MHKVSDNVPRTLFNKVLHGQQKQERQGVPAREGTRLVVFPHPNGPQIEKATSRDPLSSGTPCPLPLPKEVLEGLGALAGRGVPVRMGAEVPTRGVLWPVQKRGNTTSQVPPASRDPSHFPIEAGYSRVLSGHVPIGEGWDQGLDEQEGSDSDDDGWDMVPATRVDMDWPLSTRVRVYTVLRRGPSWGKKQTLADLLLLLTTSYVSFSHALSLRSLEYHP